MFTGTLVLVDEHFLETINIKGNDAHYDVIESDAGYFKIYTWLVTGLLTAT